MLLPQEEVRAARRADSDSELDMNVVGDFFAVALRLRGVDVTAAVERGGEGAEDVNDVKGVEGVEGRRDG